MDRARELIAFLLHATVVRPGAPIRLTPNTNDQNSGALGLGSPLPLNDGRYLRLLVSFRLDQVGEGQHRLKVYNSSYQYQNDLGDREWIVRYDYTRVPGNHHPPAHVQVNGNLAHECLKRGRMFNRMHLPTGRVSIEAVIRMLAEQFEIPCNTAQKYWRALLAESEGAFEKIAHRPGSGPAS